MDKELTIYKLIAVGAALLFLYKLTQKTGGTMQGKYNPDSIANLASHLFAPQYRPQVRQYGSEIIKRMVQ